MDSADCSRGHVYVAGTGNGPASRVTGGPSAIGLASKDDPQESGKRCVFLQVGIMYRKFRIEYNSRGRMHLIGV